MAVLRPAGEFDTSYASDTSTIRQPWQWGVLLAFVLALYALPFYASQSVVSLVNRIGITIITVQGLNLLTGYTGQISLGQAAFMTAGGYISALLVNELGWSFFAALPVASSLAASTSSSTTTTSVPLLCQRTVATSRTRPKTIA